MLSADIMPRFPPTTERIPRTPGVSKANSQHLLLDKSSLRPRPPSPSPKRFSLSQVLEPLLPLQWTSLRIIRSSLISSSTCRPYCPLHSHCLPMVLTIAGCRSGQDLPNNPILGPFLLMVPFLCPYCRLGRWIKFPLPPRADLKVFVSKVLSCQCHCPLQCRKGQPWRCAEGHSRWQESRAL